MTRPARFLALALTLALAGPAAGGKVSDGQALIKAVTAKLREQTGAEPNAAALVDGLQEMAFGLYQKGQYAEAERIVRIALDRADQVLGVEDAVTLRIVNNLAVLYKSQRRYGEAEPLFQRTLATSERLLGAEHPDTLTSVNNLAVLYEAQGRYGEAEPLFRRALEVRERVLGAEHSQTLTSFNNLAVLYDSQGRYGEAEPLYRRALEARERVLGAEHPDTLGSINNLALLYQSQGRYGEAEPLIRRALEVSERVLGAEHPQTLTIINNLAAIYREQGRYGEAEPLYRGALDARERLLGAEDPETLTSVSNLATLYDSQGHYGAAEPLYRRALEASERVLGDEHPATLTRLNDLAYMYAAQGRYGEAEPLYRRALEASERLVGTEHLQTLTSVNNLAALYEHQGRYRAAEPLCRRALEASERLLGAEHPDTLASVGNLGSLYESQGRYADAEPLYRRALEASERVLGAEHPDTLRRVGDLARLYKFQGRYSEAEPLYRRALEAQERRLGAEHPATLTSVNNLAALYRAQGRYGEAEPLYRRAVETGEHVLGSEDPVTLVYVNNLGAEYIAQGRYAEAEPLLRRALEARERVLGIEDPDTLQSVQGLARLYDAQSRYAEAEALYRRAMESSKKVRGAQDRETLDIISGLAGVYRSQARYGEAVVLFQEVLEGDERVLGPEHTDTLGAANNLAVVYDIIGRYRESERLYGRALVGRERLLGVSHPDTITVHLNLAQNLVQQGRLTSALAQLRIIDGRLRTFVGRQLDSTGSELVRRQWLATESVLQDIVFTLALAHPDSAALPLAADILLRWKHLAGNEESVIARLTRTSRDPRVLDLARQVRQARSDLSRLVNLPKSDPKATTAKLAELERLEIELAGLSRRFRGQVAGRSVEWESVQAALPRGAALLELRAFNPFDFKTGKFGEDRWLAVLTSAQPAAETDTGSQAGKRSGKKKPKESPTLRIFDLGPVSATAPLQADLARLTRESLCLNQLLAAPDPRPACADALDPAAPAKPEEVRGRLATVNQSADEAARTLYKTLFGALDKTLAGFSTLYLAPDGALDLVPFARLKLPDGRYWVERQSLRELGTGRDLLPLEPGGEAVGMIAMGGVDYERFPAAEAGVEATAVVVAPGRDAPAPLNERLRAERGSFKPLPQTGPEAAAVGRSFWDYFNRKARVLTGPEAAESSLSAITEPPLVLHLATHGFFLAARADGTDRPLTLAGLALAGANLGLAGKLGPGHQDGILYALEAQDLNLEGTRLVTLSACDTGRGALDRSEGVYGLVRAFQIAGARAVLMSLWPLDDALAAEFMGDFYRRWLAAGPNSDPSDALRAARLEWIGDKRDARRQDPAYWAPFVLMERRQGI